MARLMPSSTTVDALKEVVRIRLLWGLERAHRRLIRGADAGLETMVEHMPVRLVVHLGAHRGQEAHLYECLGAKRIVWVEADPDLARSLKDVVAHRRGARHEVVHCAASARSGEVVTLHRYSNDGKSNSLYEPTELLHERWPWLSMTGDDVQVQTLALQDILSQAGLRGSDVEAQSSLLVLDLQGHELEVLRGAGPDLVGRFSLVQCELSRDEFYEGAALADGITEWLSSAGFERRTGLPDSHGDAIFLNTSLIRSRG